MRTVFSTFLWTIYIFFKATVQSPEFSNSLFLIQDTPFFKFSYTKKQTTSRICLKSVETRVTYYWHFFYLLFSNCFLCQYSFSCEIFIMYCISFHCVRNNSFETSYRKIGKCLILDFQALSKIIVLVWMSRNFFSGRMLELLNIESERHVRVSR